VTHGGAGRHPEAQHVVVRLTEAAISDLHRLIRKDPQIARWCLKKMLLLERDPDAGEALLGGLIGFRKLTVGDRDWRVVWRVTHDQVDTVLVDVAEVWAAGARSDAEVYQEMTDRVASLGADPRAVALTQVLESLGRVAKGIDARPEPALDPVPDWLVSRLVGKAGHAEDEVRRLAPEQAMQLWDEWMSRPS
jgi:mRNA interferase RelE/StbE